MSSHVLSREAVYAALAAEQYGLVTSRQLAQVGLSRGAISRRIKAGLLLGVLPGVWRLAGFRVRGSSVHWRSTSGPVS